MNVVVVVISVIMCMVCLVLLLLFGIIRMKIMFSSGKKVMSDRIG